MSVSRPPPVSTCFPLASRTSAKMPGNGRVAEPGFVLVSPGSGRDENSARFGLPPRVDDRAAPLPDVLVIPHPRLGVDRLTDRPQQAQRAQVVLRRPVGAPAHECADGRGRRVEDRDAVTLDDLPEAPLVGPIRRPLVHHHGRAVGQRTVHDIAVPCDPPDIRRTPVDVVFLEIEDPFRRGVGSDEVPAGRVNDAFGFSRRARRVEDVEHVLCIHRFRLTLGRHVLHELVIPAIPAVFHHHGHSGSNPA